MVFVHGWSCDRAYRRAQIDHFAARSQVVAVDLAGHGESGTARSNWTMRAVGGDVVAVVGELGLREIVPVGHSMGDDVVVGAALELGERHRGVVWANTCDGLDEPRSQASIERFLARSATTSPPQRVPSWESCSYRDRIRALPSWPPSRSPVAREAWVGVFP
ncbi:MAG: alpha/beta fold hydrolase [Jatrophihabitantaceae bacterium]